MLHLQPLVLSTQLSILLLQRNGMCALPLWRLRGFPLPAVERALRNSKISSHLVDTLAARPQQLQRLQLELLRISRFLAHWSTSIPPQWESGVHQTGATPGDEDEDEAEDGDGEG